MLLLLIGSWLFSAFTIYLAARCIRESGALEDPFLPTQQIESEKEEPKLIGAGTETKEKDMEHDKDSISTL
jgi:hypothetical protein